MKAKYVHNHGPQNRQCQRHVAIRKQEDRGYYLQQKNYHVKPGHEECPEELSCDPAGGGMGIKKADEAARDYLYRGIEETGISDTDFRVLEARLHKGPLPVNTIGPKVHLTPGSISVAVDRLLEKGLVSRAESPDEKAVKT
jgi:MarR family protein